MNDVSEVDLVNIGVEGSISESCPEEHPGKNGKSLEANS